MGILALNGGGCNLWMQKNLKKKKKKKPACGQTRTMAAPHTRAVPSSHTHFNSLFCHFQGVIFEHLLGGLLDLQIDKFWCPWKDFTSYFQKLGVRIKKLFALESDCSKLSACRSDFF